MLKSRFNEVNEGKKALEAQMAERDTQMKDLETLVILDARTGEVVTRSSTSLSSRVSLNQREYEKYLNHKGKTVSLHNHSGSGRPSYADIHTLFLEKGKMESSYIAGHDGTVYKLTVDYRWPVDKIYKELYNSYIKYGYDKNEAKLRATDQLYKKGIASYEKF